MTLQRIHKRQVIELPGDKHAIRTVFENCMPIPGRGPWIIEDGGWRQVEHVKEDHWRKLPPQPKETA